MRTFASLICFLAGAVASVVTAADSVALEDIAGDYYFGDGLGVNCSFTLTARGSFTFQWNGCLGTYDKNNGSAGIKDGVLHITPRKSNLRDKGTADGLLPGMILTA